MIEYIIGAGGIFLVAAIIIWISLYRIVPPGEAHLVVSGKTRKVYSSDPDINQGVGAAYFAIPAFVPKLGKVIRHMDMTTKELVGEQETYEKNQARYIVRASLKYRIREVLTAAETFVDDDALREQLKEVVAATVRAVTVKFDVTEARANKQRMQEEVEGEIKDDLDRWGLELVSFQLVDFQDTNDSRIISNISRRREVEIESVTREQNAEKIKSARLKEAESEQKAREREIEKDRQIATAEQEKIKIVAAKQVEARTQEYEVKKVETVKAADIEKQRAIVKANQDKEVAAIIKEQQKLFGEGEKLKMEQVAIGLAAETRERGFAEAAAKEKLQAALSKFNDNSIRALVAEKIVDMQKTVGIETARALAQADVKVFAGGGGAEQGFDLGKYITSMSVANPPSADAILNRLAKPNDLGFAGSTIPEAIVKGKAK